MKVPIEELIKRDPKKIYQRFYKGDIKNVAGLDLEIDEPPSPDWMPIFNNKQKTSELANELFKIISKGKL